MTVLESGHLGKRIRRFYGEWLAPGYGTGVDSPRPAVLGTSFLVLFNWIFFYVLVPYTTILKPGLFWLGFLAWLVPPAVASLVVRNIRRENARRVYGRILTGLGLAIIIVYSLSERDNSWTPLLFASWPGVLNGIAIGIDSTLIWKFCRRRE